MQDEILAKRFSTDTEIVPYYDLVDKDGNVVQTDVQVVLKNEVVQEGTPICKSTMLSDATSTAIWGDDVPDVPSVDGALIKMISNANLHGTDAPPATLGVDGNTYFKLIS